MNFLKKIILAIALIFFFAIGNASATQVSWADSSQLIDDTINSGNTQYPFFVGTGTSTYISSNIEQCAGSNAFCAISGITTPSTFVWTQRFRAYVPSAQFYPFLWAYTGSNNPDLIYCLSTGICHAVNASTTNIATASTALPSTCYSTSALPSTWCWAKLIRNGTTATFYVAPDNNGIPGTYVQYLTSSSFSNNTGNSFSFGTINGTYQFGGNYPCVNHISSDITYDCSVFTDTKMQFNDNFWGSAAYTLSGNAAVSSNTLSIGANTDSQNDGAYFKPFGTITQGQNFVWEYRVNSNNANNALLTNIFANNPTTGICPQAALALSQQTTANYNLIYTGNACASTTTITSGLANPTPPYYVKLVYNAPSLTAYYATVTSGNTYSSLTWNTLIPSTNLSSYLGSSSTFLSNNLGSYFGFTAVNTIASIGGGNQYACQNYISLNPNFDCLTQVAYFHNAKSYSYAGSSNTIYDTFQNSTDSNLNTLSNATVGSGQFTWGSSAANSTSLYNSTKGWNNFSAFTRITNGATGTYLGFAGHNVGNNGFGCFVFINNSTNPFSLSLENYVSSGATATLTNTPNIITANTSYYLYYYINGTTQYAKLYSESSPGVVGKPITNISFNCTETATNNYFGLNNGNIANPGSYGGTGSNSFPLILRNYGTSTPPSNPSLGYLNGFTQNFSDSQTNNLSLYIIPSSNNGITTISPTVTSSGFQNTTTSTATTAFPLEPSGFTGQNKAAVMRWDANGCSTSNCNANIYTAYTNFLNRAQTTFNSTQICNFYDNGSANVGNCANLPSTATTAYDIFASNYGSTIYAQVCGESSVGVPNFSSCSNVVSNTISGVTMTAPILFNTGPNGTPTIVTYMGGAYPGLQARDYGDSQVPTTLSQFLRGY